MVISTGLPDVFLFLLPLDPADPMVISTGLPDVFLFLLPLEAVEPGTPKGEPRAQSMLFQFLSVLRKETSSDPMKLPAIARSRDQSKVLATPSVMTLAMQC